MHGKTVIITGCNRGIGKAILEGMARRGTDIIAIIRDKKPDFEQFSEEMARECDVSIRMVYADFSDEEAVKAAAKQIIQMKCPIDAIVHNTAVANESRSYMMTGVDEMKRVFQINFFSPILLTQLLGRQMIRAKKGSIVFIASAAIYDAWGNLEYTASKAAVAGAVKRLAREMGAYGVRVNAVAPTLTETEMAEKMSKEDQDVILSRNIMHRMGKPEEIADAVAYLTSDESGFITGQILRVDGGLL
ncbi:MAG: SDR family oxidoreductase [Eubacterium sp.]|nr:SDR family oxidoreductase [Eubacterium sp.]